MECGDIQILQLVINIAKATKIVLFINAPFKMYSQQMSEVFILHKFIRNEMLNWPCR